MLSSSLGGSTTYDVVVLVRNRSGEPLRAVTARGSAREDGKDVVTFDFGTAPPIAPGQTWRSAVQAVVPAPAIHSLVWQVDVRGAGPPLRSETTTDPQLGLLFVLLAIAVVSIAGVAARRLARRRDERDGGDSEAIGSQPDGDVDRMPEGVLSGTPGLSG